MLMFSKHVAIVALFSTGLISCATTQEDASSNMKKIIQEGSSANDSRKVGQADSQKTAEAMAYDALRQHLADESVTITMIEGRAIDWPDVSLGCPRPGFSYPQVIVPGYKFALQSSGETYDVHVAKKRAIVCTDALQKTSQKNAKKLVKVGTLTVATLTQLSKTNLAKNLAVPEDTIKVVAVTAARWPDDSLGCEYLKARVRGVEVPGYRITLENKGRRYTYHTDEDQRVAACPKIESL